MHDDSSIQAAYERICARQEDAIALAKAWAAISKELLSGREFPLGFPGESSLDEITALFDGVLSSPDAADEAAAWSAAMREIQDARDAAKDAQRDFREAV